MGSLLLLLLLLRLFHQLMQIRKRKPVLLVLKLLEEKKSRLLQEAASRRQISPSAFPLKDSSSGIIQIEALASFDATARTYLFTSCMCCMTDSAG